MAGITALLIDEPGVIRFAIASSSSLVRAGLATALAEIGFEIAHTAATFAELREVGFAAADIAIVDVADEGDAEIDIYAAAGPRFVLLASETDQRIGEWLIDGCAVLPRTASSQAIAGAARALLAGLVATPPAFAAEALRFERVGERKAALQKAGPLTRREREVLVAMSNGLGNREIGGALGISAHTAKFHVAQIIAKLDAQSRAHAVAKALRAGLVDA